MSTRKGSKKVAVFDLKLTLAWAAADGSVTGEIKISEFASANDKDEVVLTVSVEGKGANHSDLKKRVTAMRAAVAGRLFSLASNELLAQ